VRSRQITTRFLAPATLIEPISASSLEPWWPLEVHGFTIDYLTMPLERKLLLVSLIA